MKKKVQSSTKVILDNYSIHINTKHINVEGLKNIHTYELPTGEKFCAVNEDSPYGKTYVALPRESMTLREIQMMAGNRWQDFRSEYLPWEDGKIMVFRPNIGVRKNQMEAWEELEKAQKGILNLACGKGKTFLALAKIAHTKAKTIIVAPQTAHLENWELELKKFFYFNLNMGRIAGKSFEDGDIILAPLKSLALYPDIHKKHLEDVALSIFDECHSVSSKLFSQAADLCGGWRIGLSATPNRRDRNEGIFSSHIGKVFFSDTEQELTPTVRIVDTKVRKPRGDEERLICDRFGRPNIARIRNYLAASEKRNKLIVSEIQKCIDEGRIVYVLGHVVEHLLHLSKSFEGSTVIHGKVPTKKRLGLLNSGNPVFATISIGREAYNRVDLDTLFMITPFADDTHSGATLDQSAGRILRPKENKKEPIIFLFRDFEEDMLDGMFYSVIAGCERRGYKMETQVKQRVKRIPIF